MEYIVIEETAHVFEKAKDAITKEVMKKIAEGWEPLGGVCMIHPLNSGGYAQAMIKR